MPFAETDGEGLSQVECEYFQPGGYHCFECAWGDVRFAKSDTGLVEGGGEV